MAIATYSDLQSAIANWLNRDDLSSVIPDFIALAEADINRRVRHWRMESRATVSASTQYTELPAYFLEPIRLQITGGDFRELELISQSEMSDRRQRNNDTAGVPAFYAITNGTIELYPTPDAAYDIEVYYYSRITDLSDSDTSNWLLEYFPDAYLYTALQHSAVYLAEDQRLAAWAALSTSAIEAINAESDKAKFGGSGSRIKIRSY